MKTSFLDYYKMILEKVSFDNHLLMKEYEKALNTIPQRDLDEFNQWLVSKDFHTRLNYNQAG